MLKTALLVATALVSATAAHAAPTIVNLSANPANPNGGPVTQANGGPAANMITIAFDAGSYTVSLIGTANGGLYNAYSVATPAANNYTLQYSGFSINGAATLIQPLTGQSRFATDTAALAAYQARGPLTFDLTSRTNVSFYIEDAASAYFADDTGGVSFAVDRVGGAVPEPATWAMMIAGFGMVGGAMRRRKTSVAFA